MTSVISSTAVSVLQRKGTIMTTKTKDTYLTTKAAAEYSGLNQGYITTLVRAGKVEAITDTYEDSNIKRVRVSKASLDQYLATRTGSSRSHTGSRVYVVFLTPEEVEQLKQHEDQFVRDFAANLKLRYTAKPKTANEDEEEVIDSEDEDTNEDEDEGKE
jgi:hypothetical protein